MEKFEKQYLGLTSTDSHSETKVPSKWSTASQRYDLSLGDPDSGNEGDKSLGESENQNDLEVVRSLSPSSRRWLRPRLPTFAPGVGVMNTDFGNTSAVLSSFVVTIFVLGYAVGPLVLSPPCEIYSRPVLAAANFFFVFW
ncbi:hypothetical protein IFR05_003760 [Cadophora sp. M221]|nr:hypothetical protein IFR05_003760 [Cadophora sp. M221]